MFRFSSQRGESEVADQVRLRALVSTLCPAIPALLVGPRAEVCVGKRSLLCSLPWVRASRCLSWLCCGFGVVENTP